MPTSYLELQGIHNPPHHSSFASIVRKQVRRTEAGSFLCFFWGDTVAGTAGWVSRRRRRRRFGIWWTLILPDVLTLCFATLVHHSRFPTSFEVSTWDVFFTSQHIWARGANRPGDSLARFDSCGSCASLMYRPGWTMWDIHIYRRIDDRSR